MAYSALSIGSIQLTRSAGNIAAVWPGDGLAAAVLGFSHRRTWPLHLALLSLGNVAANLIYGDSLAVSVLLTVANCSGIVITAWCLEQLGGGSRALRTSWSFARFILGGVLLANAVSAVGGALTIMLFYGGDFLIVGVTWFRATALGMLTLVPLVVAVLSSWSQRGSGSRRAPLRALLPVATSVSVAAFVFFLSVFPAPFLLFPAVLMVAFLSGLYATAMALFLVNGVAIAATVMGAGPFHVPGDPVQSVQILQFFLTVLVLTSLAVAIALEERSRLHQARGQAEAALAQAHNFLSSILDSAAIGIVAGDSKRGVRTVNPAAERMFGYSEAEVIGTFGTPGSPLPDYLERGIAGWAGGTVADQSALQTLISTASARGKTEHETDLMRKDGSTFPAQVTLTAVTHPAGGVPGFLALIQDITARRTQDAQVRELIDSLRTARREAEAANEAKSEFLAAMSHEIRTPLNGLIGFSDLLLRTDLTEEQRQFARLQGDAGRSLLALVNDILDYSRIEAGRLEIDCDPFDLHALMRDAVGLIAQSASEKGLTTDLRIEPGVPVTVAGDGLRVRQVLLNLLTNAVKFTEAGHVVLAASAGGEGPALRFEVRDSGIGIPADKLPALFERFSQVDRSTTRQYGGSGLGLAICRRLVELMGGRIGVETAPGAGSTFWFELPLPAAQKAAAAEPHLPAECRGRSGRILLVEDVEMNRVLAKAVLARGGHEVMVAETGLEAISAVALSTFDLVLMDIQMPVMDGLEATRAIRAMAGPKAGVPIIALTANVLSSELEKCREAGMNDHITKPFDPARLLEVVARWIGNGPVSPPAPPPRPVPAAIDHAALDALEQTLGRDQVEELLQSAMAEIAQRTATILGLDEPSEIGRQAHALVSLTGNFGLELASEASRRLQAGIRAGQADCRDGLAGLHEAVEAGLAELRRRYPALDEDVSRSEPAIPVRSAP